MRSYNPLIPIKVHEEIYNQADLLIKARKNKLVELSIDSVVFDKASGKWDCRVYSDTCHECGHYKPCLHDTAIQAMQHVQQLLDYENAPCPHCNDGTTRHNCPHLFHKFPVKAKRTKWSDPNDE